jgi:aryl-alcohol dehydrogenase-like predicted oxidoreductase
MRTFKPADRIPLGKTKLKISPLGIGAWAWGDRFFWQYGGKYDQDDVRQVYQTSRQAGINLFDTAEVYGFGSSERIIRRIRSDDEDLVLASKFFPYPWRLRPAALRRALRGSLRRLGREKLELYQIHSPPLVRSSETWLEAMAQVAHNGLIQAIGVSNYNLEQTENAVETLARFDLPLASNQIRYSLLDRTLEFSGLLDRCRVLGVSVIAYSPLAQGLLTGKYTANNPPAGIRRFQYPPQRIAQIQPLLALMRKIGERHGGRSPAQVALNWTICKGTIPIPGAKNLRQARENLGALDWRLDEESLAALDSASEGL